MMGTKKVVCARTAAYRGRIHILEWAWNKVVPVAAILSMCAVEGDQLETLKWIEARNNTIKCSWQINIQYMCHKAASKGSLKVLKYLFEWKKPHSDPDFLNSVYCEALAHRQKDVVEWLKTVFVGAGRRYDWLEV